jgi:hypothetical protein
MTTEFDVPDGNRPQSEESAIARLAGWLWDLAGRSRGGLSEFSDRLLAAFRSGVSVTHDAAGQWFATLDVIDPEDNQLAALVRLSRVRPDGTRDVRRGMVDVEERNRKLFADRSSTSSPTDADLLLMYSFPLLLSVDQDLQLFREFAANELGRLRPEPVGTK